MPKAGFMTPKAIANRQKSKGLQKLRWYCQICQKQCRDDNGFKCHMMSESHQRQMLLVADKPGKFITNYSSIFLARFLGVLRRRFGTKRVFANRVYQEYIGDKEHIHMNATKWHTLSGLVRFLGREGICKVDETPKGWYIQYIDRDPETIKRQKKIERERKAVKDEEQRQADIIREQMEKDKTPSAPEAEYTELQRKEDDPKVTFNFSKPAPPLQQQEVQNTEPEVKSQILDQSVDEVLDKTKALAEKVFKSSTSQSSSSSKKQPKEKEKKLSNLEKIIQENEARKARQGPQKRTVETTEKTEEDEPKPKKKKSLRKDYWLFEGIVVKILHKKLEDGKFYKKKGTILDVIDKYTAKVQVKGTETIIMLDQDYLETVIPAVDNPVLVVNGRYRGIPGILRNINVDKFSGSIDLEDGQSVDVPYEDFSKLATVESTV